MNMRLYWQLLAVALVVCTVATGNVASAQHSRLTSNAFDLRLGSSGITSLTRGEYKRGAPAIDFLQDNDILGSLMLRYRLGDGSWRKVLTSKIKEGNATRKRRELAVTYSYAIGEVKGKASNLELMERFILKGDALIWRIRFQNSTDRPLHIGDLALPLPFNDEYVGETMQKTYERRLVMHRFIAGHGSFIYWGRASGEGPYLVMTPRKNTKLEYFDDTYEAYLHSAASGPDEPGSWHQEHTRAVLAPQGQSGDAATYGFTFHWAESLEGVRDALYQNGGFDVHIMPGMTLPRDLTARFSLRTKNAIDSISTEYPSKTQLRYLGEKDKDTHIYKASLSKLGENILTVHYGAGEHMTLQFFSTQPLETLIKKRAAFIAEKQQHRDPKKWYDGLFSLWDMKGQVLRSPENTGGLQPYMVGGSDDPSNSKPAYLSAKNVVYPDAEEIEALEYHLKHFVWGGLQRKAKMSSYPYGIFGSPNWYLNRSTTWGTKDSSRISGYEKRYGTPEGTGLGGERLWRTFDYTTYILVYYNMYRIAKMYPSMTDYLSAEGYLERAFGTAKAFFEVPYSIYMPGPPLWSHEGYADWAYKLGNFHEKYIIDLIEALRAEGEETKARWFAKEWEKKVKYFLYDDRYPFGSEFPFDRTAFESTHAIAQYAIENRLEADTLLWKDKNTGEWYSHPGLSPAQINIDAQQFMRRQIDANIAQRGWLEPTYYFLGSARVGGSYNLDYMSQMGGWSILNYSLYYAKKPIPHLRLGYASLLSSWALMNAGTPASDYGYWYPGKANDGAIGWGFKAEKHGDTWMGKELGRGAWRYDGEIDHGLSSYPDAAATVVADDPIFGWVAYGGELRERGNTLAVVPRDGVRQRLHVVRNEKRLHLHLSRDGFAEGETVEVNAEGNRVAFALENRTGDRHTMELRLSGLPVGTYRVVVGDAEASQVTFGDREQSAATKLKIGPESKRRVLIKRL